MTIRVGIDYDEPIFPWYDYAHDAAVAAGLVREDQDPPTRWDPHSHYGCSIEEWIEVIDNEVLKGPNGMYGRPIKPGVAADLSRLIRRGAEVHIVTARGSFGSLGERIKELTVQQVISEKVPYTELHFANNKYQIIKSLGLDFFLDDRYDYYLDARKAGARSYLLDERWNRNERVFRPNRLYTTRQYVDLICRRIDSPTGSEIFGDLPKYATV